MVQQQKREPTGLLIIWADVEEPYRTEYRRWHNCEHIPERVLIPGFYAARRYQGIGQAPGFLMQYETYDSKVLSSEPYLQAKNNPTPWTKATIAHFRNNGRNICSRVAASGKNPVLDAPYLFLVRFNPPPGEGKEVITWYRESHLPKICAIPGVYRGRLFEVDEEISNIATAEQKISGSGPGRHQLFALYEIASVDLEAIKNWRGIYEGAGRGAGKKLKDLKEEFYWLDFAMYAPET